MFLLYFNQIATQWYTQTHLYLILNSIQSIKQFTDGLPIYGLYELSIHLSVCALRDSTDDLLSKGCTCPNLRSIESGALKQGEVS
jgi:hypothetical protein